MRVHRRTAPALWIAVILLVPIVEAVGFARDGGHVDGRAIQDYDSQVRLAWLREAAAAGIVECRNLRPTGRAVRHGLPLDETLQPDRPRGDPAVRPVRSRPSRDRCRLLDRPDVPPGDRSCRLCRRPAGPVADGGGLRQPPDRALAARADVYLQGDRQPPRADDPRRRRAGRADFRQAAGKPAPAGHVAGAGGDGGVLPVDDVRACGAGRAAVRLPVPGLDTAGNRQGATAGTGLGRAVHHDHAGPVVRPAARWPDDHRLRPCLDAIPVARVRAVRHVAGGVAVRSEDGVRARGLPRPCRPRGRSCLPCLLSGGPAGDGHADEPLCRARVVAAGAGNASADLAREVLLLLGPGVAAIALACKSHLPNRPLSCSCCSCF